MLKNTSDLSCREDGFTLIELLIVIVIIGILAAIAIPVFLSQAQSARNASVDSDTRNAASRVAQEVAEKGFPTVAADVTALENKLTKSNGNNIKIASAGGVNYTVTGWNDDTEKYTVVFTSADGRFSKDTTTAEAGSSTGGSSTGGSGGGTTPVAQPVTVYSTGFESGLDGWASTFNVGAQSTTDKNSGSNSYKFFHRTAEVTATKTVSGLTVGKQYTFSGYFKNAGSKAQASVSIGADGTYATTSINSNGWVLLKYDFVATATTATLSFKTPPQGSDAVYADDLLLTQNN